MVDFVTAIGGPNEGVTFVLGGRTLIGRGEDCDIQVLEGDVSRRHALILRGPDGRFRIGDLTSKNGTFVEGKRATGGFLRVGDTIHLGTSRFLFLHAESFAEVLRGMSANDLRLASGQKLSRTQPGPMGRAAQAREQRESKIPTLSLATDMDWLHEDQTETLDRLYDTRALPIGTWLAARG